MKYCFAPTKTIFWPKWVLNWRYRRKILWKHYWVWSAGVDIVAKSRAHRRAGYSRHNGLELYSWSATLTEASVPPGKFRDTTASFQINDQSLVILKLTLCSLNTERIVKLPTKITCHWSHFWRNSMQLRFLQPEVRAKTIPVTTID
jgi:hypothetical protein